MSDATFTTTCARCAAPLEATDDAIKAHEERCFVAGDWVRWEHKGDWIEGELREGPGDLASIVVARSRDDNGPNCTVLAANIRRVPRPDQAVARRDVKPENAPGLSADGRATYDRLRTEYPLPPTDPLDVEHDGTRLSELLSVDEAARRENRIAQIAKWTWTPAQRAAVSAHWSAELRAKVAASSERDRLTVVIDLQDEP